MQAPTAYTAETIYTGKETLHNSAIVVNEEKIVAVCPLAQLPSNCKLIHTGNYTAIAAPFIDLQIYGANKKLFSEYADVSSLEALQQYCKQHGTAYCLPTVATLPYEQLFKCIDAIRAYWNMGGTGILGLHIEGPWIHKEKRGAHKEEWIFSPAYEQAKELLDYGKDVIKIITLAPEICSQEVLHLIKSYSIVIAAGHSNATYEQAMQSFTQFGINMATHLFNAMSAFHHRQPGLIGAILDSPSVCASIIPDGEHVHYAAIRIAKKILGSRLFAITDAVTETSSGPYQHTFQKEVYTSHGTLSGSALNLEKAFHNLMQHVQLPVEEALRMCNFYPASILKMDTLIGSLQPGARAEMLVLNNKHQIIDCIGF